MNREEDLKKAAEQYELTVLDNADLHVNYEEDNYDAGARDAITQFVSKAFVDGVEWADAHPKNPWISVNERMPEENENMIIMCEHGAIFNGTYSKGTWFCMDGYLHDTYKGNPIYSSMTGIPPLWEPIAWMPIPKFNV